MKILTMDLGKNKSVLCQYASDTGEHRFETVRTEGTALHAAIEACCPDRVVFEVGASAGWVADLVRGMGIALQVANPNHQGWRWRNVKRKTDRIDALKLAQFSAVNQLPQVVVPARNVRQWRALIGYRQQLVARRTAVKNHIRAILDREGRTLTSGKAGWTNAHRRQLTALSVPITETEAGELWRGEMAEELAHLDRIHQSIQRVEQRLDALADADRRVKQVRSVPGVGPRLGEALVAVLDDPHRFKSGKQVASYVGLTPRQYQSGNIDRQGRISGQGNAMLRALLVQAGWLGLRHNPWIREVFEHVCRGTKSRRKIAIIAVARRLLIRCWAMLRDDQVWAPPPSATSPPSATVDPIGV
ncbi:MAG: IS110 family transposase [Phycisphaerae bacterium]